MSNNGLGRDPQRGSGYKCLFLLLYSPPVKYLLLRAFRIFLFRFFLSLFRDRILRHLLNHLREYRRCLIFFQGRSGIVSVLSDCCLLIFTLRFYTSFLHYGGHIGLCQWGEPNGYVSHLGIVFLSRPHLQSRRTTLCGVQPKVARGRVLVVEAD